MRRRLVVAVALVLLVAIGAAVAWRLDRRTRPDAVLGRVVDGVVARHAGTVARPVGTDITEFALPSGVLIDVRSAALQESCRDNRVTCSDLVDRTIADVDRADEAAREPGRDDLRPMIVGDSSGYRYGFVTSPFFATLELRYVLRHGLASTFVTGTMADRLGLSGDALRDAAVAGMRRDGPATLVRLPGRTVALYRVRTDDDPVASLLDRARLDAFGKTLGTRRLAAFVPSRGVLYLAVASRETTVALDAMRTPAYGVDAVGLAPFIVDLDAPAATAMTMATREP